MEAFVKLRARGYLPKTPQSHLLPRSSPWGSTVVLLCRLLY
uniref:Uncharacterized protein n=1 Tax=Arundo donax TaxID=35708 RepID=A0A0A9D9R9_ARUDO